MKFINAEKAGFSPQRLTRLSNLLQGFVDRQELAGISAMIVRHGNIAYFQDFGKRDIEANKPMTSDTIVRIASMSKPVTALAAMLLYEEGRFNLNTPISQFLPAFQKVKVVQGKNKDGSPILEDIKNPLTVRHLLTHTSGLSYGWDPNDTVDRLYQREFKFSTVWEEKTPFTIAEFVDRLAGMPLAFQPGTQFRYGYNLDVLGGLIEAVSGQPYEEYLQERLFKPLGMADSGFRVPKEKEDRLAVVYAYNSTKPGLIRRDYPLPLPVNLWGGGGMVSTLDDYSRLITMLLNKGELDGVRLLSPTTVAMFSANLAPYQAMPSFYEFDPVYNGYGFSLGTAVLLDPGQAAVFGNAGEFYWGGAFGTYFWADPKEELFAILMTQFESNVPSPLPLQYKQLTYQAML